jgi:hypothetical protein
LQRSKDYFAKRHHSILSKRNSFQKGMQRTGSDADRFVAVVQCYTFQFLEIRSRREKMISRGLEK